MDSKAQQDNSNMQIQSPGTKTGRHHGEAIRENEVRRISLCVEIGFKLLSKRGNSEWHYSGRGDVLVEYTTTINIGATVAEW